MVTSLQRQKPLSAKYALALLFPQLLWAWFWCSGRGSPIAGAVGVVLVQWAWFTHCWSCGRGSGAVGVVHPLLELWYLVSGPASLELPGWERPPLPPTPVIDARLLGAVLSHMSMETPALCGTAV